MLLLKQHNEPNQSHLGQRVDYGMIRLGLVAHRLAGTARIPDVPK
jgi:hypothetical protein